MSSPARAVESIETSSTKWLDLAEVATVDVSSEEAASPIDFALSLNPPDSGGWRAGVAGPQTITVSFASPQRISRIFIQYDEHELVRTQAFALSVSCVGGSSFSEVVRKQWRFGEDAPSETEVYRVALDGVIAIRLSVTPDIHGGYARASLARLRIGARA
jgi:hypothetical protein